jgi:phospholipid transport system transporter-binding protein
MQLPATLTLAQATATLGTLRAALTAAPADVPFELDASGLVELDTSALAVLLDVQRLAHERHVVLQVRQPPVKLVQLATLYGVEGLLGLQGVAV